MDWKIGLIAAFAVLILVIIVTGYVKAPPDMAYIISGMGRKKKILIGSPSWSGRTPFCSSRSPSTSKPTATFRPTTSSAWTSTPWRRSGS